MICSAVGSCWGRWSIWVCGVQTAKAEWLQRSGLTVQTAKAEWLQRSGLTKLCLLRPKVGAECGHQGVGPSSY
jgi:cell division inhibitor SulA